MADNAQASGDCNSVSYSEDKQRSKTNMMAILGVALCVIFAAGSWMMMRFGSILTQMQFTDVEYKSWVMNAFIVFEIALMPVAGKLVDHVGERRVLAVGIVQFIVSSLACTLAYSNLSLQVCRAFAGGAAGIIIGTAFVVPGTVGKYKRGIPFGQELIAGAFAIGSLFAATVGYWLLDMTGDWKTMFYLNSLIVAVGGIVQLKMLPKRVPAKRKIDYPGLFGLALVFMLIAGIIEVIDYDVAKKHPFVLLLIIVAAVLVYLMYRRSKNEESPMFPVRLFRPVLIQTAVLVLASVFAIGLLQLFMKIALLGYTEMDVYRQSLMFVFLLVGAAVTSITCGHRVAAHGERKIMLLGLCLIIAGLAVSYLTIQNGLVWIYLSLAIIGAGLGSVVTTIICSTQFHSPVRDRGANTSFVVSCRMLAIIGGLAAVTNYVMFHVSDYVSSLLGENLPADQDALQIIMAILSYIIQTGVDISDAVLMRYVDAFREWTIVCMLILAMTAVAVYFFYHKKDTVEPAVAFAEDSDHPEYPFVDYPRDEQVSSCHSCASKCSSCDTASVNPINLTMETSDGKGKDRPGMRSGGYIGTAVRFGSGRDTRIW